MQRNGAFSWSRLIRNAIPNFARDDVNDVNLNPQFADNLVRWQLAQPHPPYLGPNSFFMAGLTTSEKVSKQIYKTLIKHSIISPSPHLASDPGASSQDQSTFSTVASGISLSPVTWPPPDTKQDFKQPTLPFNAEAITRNFANQMAVISVHAQRKLIGVLFFWEEECKRWAALDAEEAALLHELDLPGYQEQSKNENVHLNLQLESVSRRRYQLPSMRAEVTVNVTRGVNEDLPSYNDVANR
jgi:hypothetical protein